MIKSFEYTCELAWNTLKDYLEYQGITDLAGARDVFRQSFQRGLISAGESWMDMIASRNRTAHTYDEETAEEIVCQVVNIYYPLFTRLEGDLNARANSTT